MMNLVLLEPEIPYNTGNIGRTCVLTGTALHLIAPFGFSLSDRAVKRAGMDYWPQVNLRTYDCLEDFYEKNPAAREGMYFATTKGLNVYSDVKYRDGDYIMFGKESAGIPESILVENRDKCIRIPMMPTERSLNLSNSAAIVLYEALRQNGFPGMETKGELHYLSWEREK